MIAFRAQCGASGTALLSHDHCVALAYAHMGRLLFGFLVPRERVRQEWKGCRVNLNTGTVGDPEIRALGNCDTTSTRA